LQLADEANDGSWLSQNHKPVGGPNDYHQSCLFSFSEATSSKQTEVLLGNRHPQQLVKSGG
jgi:hypothetical protein